MTTLDDEDTLDDQAAATAAKLVDDGPRTVAPFYPDVATFVEREFAPVFVRRITPTFRWCPQWWRHPEAISRLTELWRSWEVLRLDPLLGMGVWYSQHLDHHLPLLTSGQGPFESCDGAKGKHFNPAQAALPTDPAPADWWPHAS